MRDMAEPRNLKKIPGRYLTRNQNLGLQSRFKSLCGPVTVTYVPVSPDVPGQGTDDDPVDDDDADC